MHIERLSRYRVLADAWIYQFTDLGGAEGFEACLRQGQSLEYARSRFPAESKHRRPVKMLPTRQEYADRRREANELWRQDQRAKRVAQARASHSGAAESGDSPSGSQASHGRSPERAASSSSTTASTGTVIAVASTLAPPVDLSPSLRSALPLLGPYAGKYVSYVVHGHGGHYAVMAASRAQFKSAVMQFYCAQGQTTQDTERANPMNAPRKLIGALLTSQADAGRVHETRTWQTGCEPLLLAGDANPHSWPDMGIWFVARDRADASPTTTERIFQFDVADPTKLLRFDQLWENVVLPDARRRGLKAPLDVFWVACRAAVRTGEGVAEAGVRAAAVSSSAAAAAAATSRPRSPSLG